MSTLWLIRHGKSAEGKSGQSDFDRPLNGRGIKNGARMRKWFAQQSDPAQWVWTSPAVRAKATAEFVAEGFSRDKSNPVALVEAPSLYLAGPETLLDCLRETPPDIDSVAIVAHNPGLTHLVNLLAESSVTDNLVTFGTARMQTASTWVDLAWRDATLVELMVPRELD